MSYHTKTKITGSLMNSDKNYKGFSPPSQHNLVDRKDNGKRYLWHIKKLFNSLFADTMTSCPEAWSKSVMERVLSCSSCLKFIECEVNPSDPKKLTFGNFCKHPLCPACQKRRQMKNFANTVKVLHHLNSQGKNYEYILLTLTTPNVSLEDLKDEIRRYFKSWRKLMMRREVKKIVKGFVRTMEITYNSKTNTYNPHIHALIAVNKSYFTDKTYIKHDRWLELWRESTKQPEITNVHVCKIKKRINEDDPDGVFGISREICKYITKEWSEKDETANFVKNPDLIDYGLKGHIWIRDTKEQTARVVEYLAAALHHQRLFEFGGVLKDAKKELNLQDADDADADLVNTGEESTGCKCKVCGGGMQETVYTWYATQKRYYSQSSKPYIDPKSEKKFTLEKLSK